MNGASRIIPLLGVTVMVVLLAAACGGGGPKEHRFSLQIQGGQPVGGPTTLKVKQGDTVTINLLSDADGEMHLHGYDLEVDLAPGQPVPLALTADATGRFLLEIEETEVQLGYLEVQPR